MRSRTAIRCSLLVVLTQLALACGADAVGDQQKSAVEAGSGGDGGGRDGGRANDAATKPPSSEGGTPSQSEGGTPSQSEGGTPPASDDGTPPPVLPCAPVHAQPIPAREGILQAGGLDSSGGDSARWYRRQDLCDLFSSPNTCGNCHWGHDDPEGKATGVFQVTCASIDQKLDLATKAAMRVWSSDPSFVMPPTSDGSKLSPDSPIALVSDMLTSWDNQGKADLYQLERGGSGVMDGGTASGSPFKMNEALGYSLTNIGSCVPSPQLPKLTSDMKAKDEMFAAVQSFEDLPKTLRETDFVSLDSQQLAQHGVYSYQPTYTLFSDHALKMRYLRVPVGQSIRYNPDTQGFDIPENTRFYKTFLKEVIDKDGRKGYRKMETRLIISRHDREFQDGRPPEIRAIRASYAWDEDEQNAVLVTDPLQDQTPFADRLCPYITDERGDRDTNGDGVVDKKDANPIKNNPNCTYMSAEELDDPKSGTIRHYAIPARTRCDECHMGSRSRSFILGFTPWHADRRKEGEGGTFDDPPTPDELSQLQRLIDYGVVTGIVPGQAKLEESEGDRKPRNDYELRAQGYMMSNCAFCHNQNGFPTRQNPVLAPFNLMPDHEAGGIFQFSLERYSPREAHVTDTDVVPLPYITPSFGSSFPLGHQETGGQSKKRVASEVNVVVEQDDASPDQTEFGPDVYFSQFYLLGPWRSLIWRNTYTPFTYQDQNALFIHMPRNVPGFDVRANRIMASWMLSIPARAKPSITVTPENPDDPAFAWLWAAQGPEQAQPAEEVLPGDPDYEEAKQAAEARVQAFLTSVTGQHQPPDSDVVAPEVLNSESHRTASGTLLVDTPAPVDDGKLNAPRVHPDLLLDANVGIRTAVHTDGVPARAHWVVVDNTDLPGVWHPRRGNWRDLIAVEKSEYADATYQRTLDQIRTMQLTSEQEQFSLEPVPLGLWSDSCNPDVLQSMGARTASDFRADDTDSMQHWLRRLDSGQPRIPDDAYVHTQARGQAVFTAICQNCHGPQADSRSPLATTILELTGGNTRVANFVDGLFGPRAVPGMYAQREFFVEGSDASPAEWQARYMLFMTLGGTEKQIPEAVLRMVSVAPFYGRPQRTGDAAGSNGANMLQSAQQACRSVVKPISFGFQWKIGPDGWVPDGSVQPFLPDTGHFELWESICSFGNEPLVRVFQWDNLNDIVAEGEVYRSKDDAGAWVYPTDALVGDQYGNLTAGIQPGNTTPWCVVHVSSDDDDKTEQRLSNMGYSGVPWCPQALFEAHYTVESELSTPIHRFPLDADPNALNGLFAERWYRRGAMNAGLAAYYFLDRWTKGLITPAPAFDAAACKGSGP